MTRTRGTLVTRIRGARLIGDGLENPANAAALLDAAAMFTIPCLFRDSRSLATQSQPLAIVETQELLAGHAPIVAVENTPDAATVYTAALPPASRRSLSATSAAGSDRTCCVPPRDACRSPCPVAA